MAKVELSDEKDLYLFMIVRSLFYKHL